jgi:type VI secretion system protein ImpA
VHELATTFLTTRSKDLQVAAWLLEAWIRIHGFAGARMGFGLLLELCDRYWPDLYPLPDGDDLGARASTIEWINEKLRLPILEVPITRPTDPDGRPWTWAERTEALRREAQAKRLGKNAKPAPEAEAWLTIAKFNNSVANTPRQVFVDLDSDLAASIGFARVFQQQLDQYFGSNAPSLTRIIDLQNEIRQWLGIVLAERIELLPPAATAAPSPAVAAAPTPVVAVPPVPSPLLGAVMHETSTQTAPAAAPTDQIAARIEAYRKLAEAADTLMRIEPHSPTPYLVRRAIAWGGMSLVELMRHFIESGYDLKSLQSMLGMNEEGMR